MLVRVFHIDESWHDPEGVSRREVFAYTQPDPAVGSDFDHVAMLDHISMVFGMGDDPVVFGQPDPLWVAYEACRLRKIHMGDVIALDDTYFTSTSTGWQRYTPPNETKADSSADAHPNGPRADWAC